MRLFAYDFDSPSELGADMFQSTDKRFYVYDSSEFGSPLVVYPLTPDWWEVTVTNEPIL